MSDVSDSVASERVTVTIQNRRIYIKLARCRKPVQIVQ